MKKTLPTPATGFTVCLLCLLLCAVSVNPSGAASGIPAIDAIIVRGSSLGPGAPGPKNGAILLDAPAEIGRHVALFLENRRLLHACGYTYELEFWSGTELHDIFAYNIECGEKFLHDTETIASLMAGYNARFIAETVNTSHYLKVPVSMDPPPLMEAMRRDGLRVFPVGGAYARFPALRFTHDFQGKDTPEFETEAEEAMRQFLINWPPDLPRPVHYTQPEFSSSLSSGSEKTITFFSIVRFPLDTDTDAIAATLEAGGLTVTDKATPTHYVLKLISPEKDRTKIAALVAGYPEVTIAGE